MESAEGKAATRVHDVMVHGIRVRAHTNSPHLIDFWLDNWYTPAEWKHITGKDAPIEPQIMVYAFGGIAEQAEAAYYSREHNTVIFFNTSYYGQLKSWVLGSVGRVLADEYGIHSLHGAAVELSGRKGVLYVAPTGTGKSTSSYGLMKFPNTRFHSDDWVYVRYVYQTKDGKRVGPRRIEAPDGPVDGYRCFRWLEENPTADVPMTGLTPENDELQLRTSDLALDKGIEAYTYISEKVFYLRTNLVENFPEAALDILNSKKENVPDITPEFLEEHRTLLDHVSRLVMEADHEPTRNYFQEIGEEKTREVMGRLFAFDNARAMLDVTPVFGKERVFTNPLEPLFVTSVFLLRRDFDVDDGPGAAAAQHVHGAAADRDHADRHPRDRLQQLPRHRRHHRARLHREGGGGDERLRRAALPGPGRQGGRAGHPAGGVRAVPGDVPGGGLLLAEHRSCRRTRRSTTR